MAEYKANLLTSAKALCKKEDIAPDRAVLLIGDDVDNVTIDELLVSLSEVVVYRVHWCWSVRLIAICLPLSYLWNWARIQ